MAERGHKERGVDGLRAQAWTHTRQQAERPVMCLITYTISVTLTPSLLLIVLNDSSVYEYVKYETHSGSLSAGSSCIWEDVQFCEHRETLHDIVIK